MDWEHKDLWLDRIFRKDCQQSSLCSDILLGHSLRSTHCWLHKALVDTFVGQVQYS